MSTRSNFFGGKKASADTAYLRATASSYIIAEKSPANKKVDNSAKPSIKVTDLIHDEATNYQGTFDTMKRVKDRVTIYRARI
jgi:hypothetical protein